MEKLNYCPFCNGMTEAVRFGDRPALVCRRCNLAVMPLADMTDSEFKKRFNRRASEKESYSTTLEGFVRKRTGSEILRVLKDYQPCSKQEIQKRIPWMTVYLDRNLNEAVDLELIKCSKSGEYTLTPLGKSVARQVFA